MFRPSDQRIKKENRNTTYYSLHGVLELLTAETKEDFCRAYKKATHDNAGGSSWGLMREKGAIND